MPGKIIKMPYLSSLAGEIDKLVFETEEEAKKIVTEDIAAARLRKDEVMSAARLRLTEHSDSVKDIHEQLDRVAEVLGSNSGDRPPQSDNSKS